jgi:heme exporter protein B
MNSINQIREVLKMELGIELRSGSLIISVGLQVVAFILIMYYGLISPGTEEWATFFWIIVCFAATSGLSRSFLPSEKSEDIYMFQLFDPVAWFLAKLLLNTVYIFLTSVFSFFLMYLVYGYMLFDVMWISVLIILASIGFSSIFTFAGAVSGAGKNSRFLLPLLALPLMIPLLMVLFFTLKLIVVPAADWSEILPGLGLLLVLDLIYCVNGTFLFKQVWGG